MRQWLARMAAALLIGAPLHAETAGPTPPSAASWHLLPSDLPFEPGYQLGTLPNGLRYAIRRNGNPAGTALVRLVIEAGSLDETDDERGYAHFVEHMAFEGSAHVPPGEMVRLLERRGLAFGADTNATTSYDETDYKLDLPRADPGLLDTALMLLRETASELSFAPAEVARERGVVLAERRERDNWALRAAIDRQRFAEAGARYVERQPIGTLAALERAEAAGLRHFWQRHYVPARAIVIVVGDLDPALVRAAIEHHFASWAAAPALPRPAAGPIAGDQPVRESIYLDPALSEAVSVMRSGAYQDEPDTRASRRLHLLRALGYAMINRRLQHLAQAAVPPFIAAGFGTSDLFRDGRMTALSVQTRPGTWRAGLAAAGLELRRALARGFTRAELDEALANARTGAEDAAAGAATRHNSQFLGAIEALAHDAVVPTDPRANLEEFRAFAPTITPAMVTAQLAFEVLPLDDPAHPALLRFEGKTAPEGGATALRAAWNAALATPLGEAETKAQMAFAYTSFGPPGRVVADRREPHLGIRLVRFANGVRLNLKRTAIDKDQVRLNYEIDGGEMLNTRAEPLATAMSYALPAGGLGKHSADALQSILAGHAVGLPFYASARSFGGATGTTPRDLPLQLQLLAALITDPGYRPEGERRYADAVERTFAAIRATPAGALALASGGLLSDNDPRFTFQGEAAYKALTFARLKAAIADRLAHGAIEIGIVGDIDEAATISAVAATFGALPPREPAFLPHAEARKRAFSKDHTMRVVRHSGPADQALVSTTWLTRDDADPAEKQVLNLLDRVMRIELDEVLRQQLGKAYSPQASSDPSRIWPGWGTFTVTTAADVRDLPAVEAALAATVKRLQQAPVSADLLDRARQPLLQSLDNALKSNAGWLALVAEAASHPDRVERHTRARARLLAVTPALVQAAARRYLVPARAVPVRVLPAGLIDQPAVARQAPADPAAPPARPPAN